MVVAGPASPCSSAFLSPGAGPQQSLRARASRGHPGRSRARRLHGRPDVRLPVPLMVGVCRSPPSSGTRRSRRPPRLAQAGHGAGPPRSSRCRHRRSIYGARHARRLGQRGRDVLHALRGLDAVPRPASTWRPSRCARSPSPCGRSSASASASCITNQVAALSSSSAFTQFVEPVPAFVLGCWDSGGADIVAVPARAAPPGDGQRRAPRPGRGSSCSSGGRAPSCCSPTGSAWPGSARWRPFRRDIT